MTQRDMILDQRSVMTKRKSKALNRNYLLLGLVSGLFAGLYLGAFVGKYLLTQ